MSLRHQRCFPSPSIPCLCLSFFISSFFLSPILTSSLPSLVQSLYSHANNTRLLHTSQQDISERVHLRLQLLWPSCLPAASLSSLLLRHQRESLSTASPREKSSRAETVVCSFLHYFLLTVGGTVASPSPAVSQISASTLVWEPWKQSSAQSDEQFKRRRFALLRSFYLVWAAERQN